MCKKKITLNKHTNTKHGKTAESKVFMSKCSLCEDRFETESELKNHKNDHLEEIEGLDISNLTNGYEFFKCNLCSFEYGHEDSI